VISSTLGTARVHVSCTSTLFFGLVCYGRDIVCDGNITLHPRIERRRKMVNANIVKLECEGTIWFYNTRIRQQRFCIRCRYDYPMIYVISIMPTYWLSFLFVIGRCVEKFRIVMIAWARNYSNNVLRICCGNTCNCHQKKIARADISLNIFALKTGKSYLNLAIWRRDDNHSGIPIRIQTSLRIGQYYE
jgi:hypothetical protein